MLKTNGLSFVPYTWLKVFGREMSIWQKLGCVFALAPMAIAYVVALPFVLLSAVLIKALAKSLAPIALRHLEETTATLDAIIGELSKTETTTKGTFVN